MTVRSGMIVSELLCHCYINSQWALAVGKQLEIFVRAHTPRILGHSLLVVRVNRFSCGTFDQVNGRLIEACQRRSRLLFSIDCLARRRQMTHFLLAGFEGRLNA